MKGKTIEKVVKLGSEYELLVFTDGSAALVKNVAVLSKDELLAIIPGIEDANLSALKNNKPEKEEKGKKDEKSKKDKKVEEPVDDDETINGEDLAAMSFKAMKKLCKESELDTDPKDFSEDEEAELREAIAKELGLELPKEEEEEEEDEDTTLTWEDLEKLDFNELSDLCDEEKLDTDPEDFDEDEDGDEDKLRRKIAQEMGIEAPEKKKKKKK